MTRKEPPNEDDDQVSKYEARKSLPDAERIELICGDIWVNYGFAQKAIERLERLLVYPPRDRMPCLLIYGTTGMGKTKIIKKFLRSHPPVFDGAVGNTSIPVVAFQMPPEPIEGHVYEELCRALGAAVGGTRNATISKNVARHILHKAGTRMIIIDEIHSMLSGTHRAQMIFLNALRFLANDVRATIVCVGTEEARLALLGDLQLAERFDALELMRWQNDADLGRLLATISTLLPLRQQTRLDTAECREIILNRTDGITVRIFRLLESAAIQAIHDGSECITAEGLSSKDLMLPLVSMAPKSTRRF